MYTLINNYAKYLCIGESINGNMQNGEDTHEMF